MSNSVVFIGAGASEPFGIPTMTKMAEEFEAKLREQHSQNLPLFEDIRYRLRNYQGFDIEALITVLQDIINIDNVPTEVFNRPSVHYFAAWGLSFEKMIELNKEGAMRNHDAAEQLLTEVKRFIADACTIKQHPFEIYEEFFQLVLANGLDFRAVLRSRPPRAKCTIFTTNYDCVIEGYCDSVGLEYACGQAPNELLDIAEKGSRLYSPNLQIFQIHKLHGSINWYVDVQGRMRWLTEPAVPGRATVLGHQVIRELLIHPAAEKYTYREPFYTMFHHLKERLVNTERCYVVGYSFRDDNILGLFHDAMELNKKLRLSLIDIHANSIVQEKFPSFSGRIQPIGMEFCVEAAKQLG